MEEILRPIPGHSLLLLLLQLTALLVLARVLAEGMRRVGQPAVIGELLAGVLLGPTILGHFAPGLFLELFPQDAAQFHLLEVISWLGMVLLLLLTGLETDIRAMRHLGRAALMASIFGMVVPFASGLALGWMLPDAYLTDPATRPIFAAFLATAMAISAMPVIAKILMDLDLIRRDVGMVILSAGVVDDTTGWLILSIIAGIASGGAFSPAEFGKTLLWLALFLVTVRWVAYPLFVRAIRYVNERVDLAGGDLTLILGVTFLAAAVTEAIGIHAVFGAFVAGLMIRQAPRVRPSSLHTLEVFVLSALSPVFFAFVGLKVDLWALSGWQIPLLVISVAVGGKLAGCYLGGRLGRLSHWESLAIGFGMNARGAMELIVALIGLSLGLLTQEMYSTIVMVAVVTSFMAPLLLRIAVPHIPVGEEERRRLAGVHRTSMVPTAAPKILVPTAGGENAMSAFRLAAPMAGRPHGQLTALYVDQSRNGNGRPRWKRRGSLAGTNLESHLDRAANLVNGSRNFAVRQVRAGDVAGAVIEESARDYDYIFLGAAAVRPLHDALTQRIVSRSRVPTVVVRHLPETNGRPLRRILVPFDGGALSRHAAELAFAWGGAAGAEVVVLHVVDRTRLAPASIPIPDRQEAHALPRREAEELGRPIRDELGPLAESHGAGFSVRILASGSPGQAIIEESRSGDYDLLVLGTENKLVGRPLFFGQGTGEILEAAGCTTAVLLPAME